MKAARMMAVAIVGVGLAAASSYAQPVILADPSRPAAPLKVSEELQKLSARIDRRQAEGRLTEVQAKDAREKVAAIQSEAAADRSRDGGQLTTEDRIAILSEIDRVNQEIDAEAGPRPPAEAGPPPR